MTEQYIFTMNRLNKFYGQKQILKDINLCFFPGAKIGIVGDNGSGKTTLLKIMAQVDREFDGYAEPAKNVKIGYIPQEPVLNEKKNVRENIAEAFSEIISMLKEYEEVTEKMGNETDGDEMEKLMNRMSVLQEKIDMCNGWELETQLNKVSNALLLPPDDMDVTKLSGGERRRVALCKVLLEQPDLLLLDEPTNHLDAETVQWLEDHLKNYPGTVIIVTHDRYFLDNITKWILELDAGKGIPFEGNYSSWLDQKQKILENTEKSESRKQKFLKNEIQWIRTNKKGKQSLSKSRINQYEQLLMQENSLNENSLEIQICPGPKLGKLILNFDNISKGYNGNTLIDKFSFSLPHGAVVGLIGPNGAGKTTMFRMITEQEIPDSGKIEMGETVKLAYVDQHRDNLDSSKSVYDEIRENVEIIKFGNISISARNYVGRFNFKGSDQQKLVGNLSGGERNRVHLAKLLKSGGNLILLDEPTNDLDISTLRNLEEAILNFSGCVMLISHDRFFLDRVCTHLIVFEGNGQLKWFEGNFKDYEEFITKEYGPEKLLNRRSKYRKINLK
ncbi:energy-dependent translational throttle protein EttA [Candidatus Dependentiae bacterium]|nr:energy-dependent translational throttle protein EttA [Candidatus Dependentiae bacterium]